MNAICVVCADDVIQRHRELLSDWLRDECEAFVSCNVVGCIKVRGREDGGVGGSRYQESASYC